MSLEDTSPRDTRETFDASISSPCITTGIAWIELREELVQVCSCSYIHMGLCSFLLPPGGHDAVVRPKMQHQDFPPELGSQRAVGTKNLSQGVQEGHMLADASLLTCAPSESDLT